MKTSATQTHTCTETLKLLADFWSLRIIEALQHETLRYCELQRALDDLNPATLSKKLGTLEENGLVERSEEEGSLAVTYTLTSLGKDALPVIKAIDTFAKRSLGHS